MESHLSTVLCSLAAIAAGGLIGYAFGLLQDLARSRHEQMEKSGKLKSAWTLMPGSGGRVAYLLIVLVLVQFLCPLMFADGTQWFVSAGVVAGYGVTLFRRLRQRLAAERA
jgi:hypothetical protein